MGGSAYLPCASSEFISIQSSLFSVAPDKGPTVINLIPTATGLKVTWGKLSADESNGAITKYQVCYHRGSSVSDCTNSKEVIGIDNTITDLTLLEPATIYTVAVRAFTAVGSGPLGVRKTATTLETGRFTFSNVYCCN